MTLFNHYTATDSDDERCYIIFYYNIIYNIIYLRIYGSFYYYFFFIKSPRGNSSTRILQTKKDFYLFCVPRTRGTPDRHTRFFFFFFFCDFVKGEEKKYYFCSFSIIIIIITTWSITPVDMYTDPILACLLDCPVLCAMCIFWIARRTIGTPVRLSCSIRPSDRRVAVISTATTFGHNLLYYYKYIYRK